MSENPRPEKPCANYQASRAYYLVSDPEDAAAEPERISLNPATRLCWTLEALMQAGEVGCTPRDRPAPRWSMYVADLRKKGVEIDTVREPHGGDYPGWHGRYVLRSKVRRDQRPEQMHGETGSRKHPRARTDGPARKHPAGPAE